MPSIKKRIGYLPSPNFQKIISKLANKEKLSQSKVVDLLVEEALIARGLVDLNNQKDLRRGSLYKIENNMNNSSYSFNDLDEMISDKGITYNTKNPKSNSNPIWPEPKEEYNEELFEQFKQFILFQKMEQKQK